MKRNSIKIIAILLIIFINCQLINAQDRIKLDSLFKITNNEETSDSIKAKTFYKISSDIYANINVDSMYYFGKKAYNLALKRNIKNIAADALMIMGRSQTQNGYHKSALDDFEKSLDIYRELNDSLKLTDAYQNIARVYFNMGEFLKSIEKYNIACKISSDIKYTSGNMNAKYGLSSVYNQTNEYGKAYDILNEILEYHKNNDNLEKIAATNLELGNSNIKQGSFSSGIKYYQSALYYFQKNNSKRGVGMALVNISTVYAYQKKHEKALDFALQALKVNLEMGHKLPIARTQYNIGTYYLNLKDYKNANDFYERSLKLSKSINNKIMTGRNIIGIAYIKIAEKEYNTPIPQIKESIIIFKEKKHLSGEINCYNILSELYYYTNKKNLSLKYANKAYRLAEKTNDIEQLEYSTLNLYRIYESQNKYEKALSMYKQNKAINDSLNSNQNSNTLTDLEYKYKYDIKAIKDSTDLAFEKNKMNDTLRIQKEETEAKISKIKWVSFIVLLIGIFSIWYYKSKQKQQKQKEENERRLLMLQTAESEMKALRSQMNPHFIFNALQSIQNFLLTNNNREANTYLLKFSKLMRLVLENSQHQEVSIEEDKEALELYMQLESIRLKKPFTYSINIDDSIDQEEISIPPLILQPFVENAIWHGLSNKEDAGHIDINISKIDDNLVCSVVDNGIGREKSKELKTNSFIQKESLGMKITEERLKVRDENTNSESQINVLDLYADNNKPEGTKIELIIPIAS